MLEFGWRNVFKDLSSSVAHSLIIAVEDFSYEILEHEQKEQSSATYYMMCLVNVQNMNESWRVVHEKEQPKQISKACIQKYEGLRFYRIFYLLEVPIKPIILINTIIGLVYLTVN